MDVSEFICPHGKTTCKVGYSLLWSPRTAVVYKHAYLPAWVVTVSHELEVKKETSS